MDDNLPEGWSLPVRQALAAPHALLMGGIPQTLCVILVLGTILLAMVTWRALLLGGGIYLILWLGTQWEVQWWEMLQRYWRYKDHYEG